ncbi:uncharacterized protein [Mytilus edulis]|uniref:uncharacterized protein n=1 Tax=Mytilus edulis TaxID=6550 RepID=UPI0039EE5783
MTSIITELVYIYRIKVEEQLNDSTFYSEIPDNIDHLVKRRMNTVLNKYTTATTEKEYDYLKNFERKTSNFYGLPKIHKSKEIQSAINSQQNEYIKVQKPTDLKLRPIIAGPASPTHRLSNFLDIILKPLCKYVPSYIRDDIDFLSHLPKIAPVHARLVSFDVTSLYTNIPHDLGIEAIQYWVAKHRDAIPNRFTVDFILDSTKLILENNSFYFNGKNYLQHRGTAMGTKFAPTYATLVMGFLEQRLYQEVENNFGVEFAREFELSWKRYLDDCFIIWNKSDEELQLFSDILNNLHTSIKFTKDENFNQLPFLDILVIKDGTEIKTDIFYKGTDTHQYLDFNSCHPSHTKRNIPYCLARKICTVVEDEHLREDRLEELQSFLIKQNYPETLIERGIKMANQIPTNQLRSTCEEQSNNNDKIPFVITHNPRNFKIIPVAKAHLPILDQDEKMRRLINTETLLQSKRQPQNLKRLLTRARFDQQRTFSVSKCRDSRCGACPYIHVGKGMDIPNGLSLFTNEDITCKSENLIYCIKCNGCQEIYIGQTGNSVTERVRIHRQHIRQPQYRKIPLSKHLDECGGGFFKIFPFYKMNMGCDITREVKEKHFISKFKSRLNANYAFSIV